MIYGIEFYSVRSMKKGQQQRIPIIHVFVSIGLNRSNQSISASNQVDPSSQPLCVPFNFCFFFFFFLFFFFFFFFFFFSSSTSSVTL